MALPVCRWEDATTDAEISTFMQDVRCPVCNHLLFRALPWAELAVEVRCTCKRVVIVGDVYTVRIAQL